MARFGASSGCCWSTGVLVTTGEGFNKKISYYLWVAAPTAEPQQQGPLQPPDQALTERHIHGGLHKRDPTVQGLRQNKILTGFHRGDTRK